ADRRNAVRRFLADLGRTNQQPSADALILSEAWLFDWLVGEAQRHSAANAIRQLGAVNRYVRALTRAGALETDVMVCFQERYRKKGWRTLVRALRAPDPVAA